MDLTVLNKKEIEAEIRLCLSDCERELGVSARFFLYPYGRNNQTVRDCSKMMGFHGAVMTQPSALVTEKTDPFALPRLETSKSMLDLRLWLTGALPGLAKKLFGRVYE